MVSIGSSGAAGRADVQLPPLPFPPVVGQASFPLTVAGKTATAVIELPGGYATDLTISFERVVGLHARAMEVSARVVSPTDPMLLARLPGGLPSTIPAAFPVLLQIEPTSGSTLSFSGVVTVSHHTHNLNFDPAVTRSLYSASAGGSFRDITRSVGMGSYRVDGSGGGFSEFLIATDNRPIDVIVLEKFAAITALLTDHEAVIDAEILGQLRMHLDHALGLYTSGNLRGAIESLSAFERDVRARSGRAVPDTWSALGGPANVAGLLRAASDTLQFSLTVKASLP
jgi:hypothetical protein